MNAPASLRSAPATPPFLTAGRLAGALALYFALAVVPPSLFERPLFIARLLSSPAPDHVGMPVAGVAPSALRGSWGAPRGGGRHHQGIDIFAPRGTRVVAAVHGIVWRVGTDPLGGLVVLLLGPGGQTHYYAHLDRQADLRVGDPIAAGDTVGFVGTTGNARGGPPHLHYGIYTAGGAIDPFPLLTRLRAESVAGRPATRGRTAIDNDRAGTPRSRTDPVTASDDVPS